MTKLPRGIAPELLISQVKNTMPYLFLESDAEQSIDSSRFPPALILRAWSEKLPDPLTHLDYFKLCLSSHYLTCGTPVPTDVDIQIRKKLWPKQLPLETAAQMARFVLESHHWDFTQVSSRYTFGAPGSETEKTALSGQLGEWFTVACGSYCALLQYSDSVAANLRSELFQNIRDEVQHHSETFGSLWRAGDGLNCLKTSANIAHNLGDLDRVMDMWELPPFDPLRTEFYKLGVEPLDSNGKLRHLGRLWVAGELYKSAIDGSSMALENHRHYALRKPKAIRSARALLIPTAPFFDDWGKKLATELKSSDGSPSADTREVVEALALGWDRQPNSYAYGRALRSLFEYHPHLTPLITLDDLIQKGFKRKADFERALATSQTEFESRWNTAALSHMDDIPSRA